MNWVSGVREREESRMISRFLASATQRDGVAINWSRESFCGADLEVGDEELGFGHVKLGMPTEHLSGATELATG